MPDFTSDISDTGLLRRQFRDVHSIVSRLDHQMRRIAEPQTGPTPRELLTKSIVCHALSQMRSNPQEPVSAAQIAAEKYRHDQSVLWALGNLGLIGLRSATPDTVGKAASAPATTTTTGWAAELAPAGVSDAGFLQLMAPSSVYAQLSSRPKSIRVNLSGHGSVRVPARAVSPTLASPFVAEAATAPVRSGGFVVVATLTPKKTAGISVISREMQNSSIPQMETVVKILMDFDTSVAIDAVLLGSGAISASSPAGLLNGVSGQTPTAGGTVTAFIADLRLLTAAIESSGPMFDPVLIMSSSQALILPALLQGGEVNMPIIVSPNVPAKTIILIDAANFASAEGDTPRIETTNSGLLHMEDTTPLAIGTAGSPPTVAAPAQELFQTDCIGIKHVQDVDWVMTRSGRVSFVNLVTW